MSACLTGSSRDLQRGFRPRAEGRARPGLQGWGPAWVGGQNNGDRAAEAKAGWEHGPGDASTLRTGTLSREVETRKLRNMRANTLPHTRVTLKPGCDRPGLTGTQHRQCLLTPPALCCPAPLLPDLPSLPWPSGPAARVSPYPHRVTSHPPQLPFHGDACTALPCGLRPGQQPSASAGPTRWAPRVHPTLGARLQPRWEPGGLLSDFQD